MADEATTPCLFLFTLKEKTNTLKHFEYYYIYSIYTVGGTSEKREGA